MPRDGVVIVAFGGPDCLDAVGPFMCSLMGREPSPDLLARTRARYEQIGGASPLHATARALATSVGAALAESGEPLPVEVGMRYSQPLIADAVESLASQGVERIVMVSLSPYEAAVTHGEYRAALESAATARGIEVLDAPVLSATPAFVDLQTDAAQAALAGAGDGAPLVFSAHSLPRADVEADDSYVRGLEAAAAEVASRLGLAAGSRGEVLPGIEAFGTREGARPWLVAYQSKGARGGEWLGPDLDDVIDAVAAQDLRGIVVVPLGFATDHMETCYDIDVVSAGRAAERGIAFVRSTLPNADPVLAAGIARAVRETLG